ncbi:MAG TPA: hypothetical protein VJ971_16555 [Methylomirabilota bacterium]|nr:hypothetical protein [Methylomirabilota bacterium]
MPTLLRCALLVLVVGGLVLPVTAPAAPLPERTPPAGFGAANGPGGGRTLAGTFTGSARSAGAVLGGVLGALRGYFDGAPTVSSAVGDPGDRGIMAFFDARLLGTPVRGAVMIQLNDGGGGGVAVIFDRPADIGRSFKSMARQLGSVPVPGGGQSQRPVALQQQTTPDGKAAIGVPPGWRISGYGNGAVDVAGPQGQLVDVGIYLPIFSAPTYGGPIPGAVYLPFIADPATAVRAVSEAQSRQAVAKGGAGVTDIEVLDRVPTPPPTGAGQAAYLFVRSRIGGRPHLHFALVNTAPIDQRSWAYYYSTVAAPDGIFQRDFALMLNVWRSWSLNQQMLRDRMQDAANKMRQTGEILRSAARGQSEAFDRANKGFDYYIQGVEVLEHTSSGARGNFDRDFADAVVKADPTKFRLVPPSQYRTTD